MIFKKNNHNHATQFNFILQIVVFVHMNMCFYRVEIVIS